MILKASQRKGGKNLAEHLLRGDTNEHVTVHDVRGFISDDIEEAFQEAYALSLGTNCTQYLFSLSLNPPDYADMPIGDFEEAIDKIEKALGLTNHPRVIVFHEKNGRRHCHCVWSRIFHDGHKFKALNMAHYKLKLMSVSHALFLKHKWKLPKGFQKDKEPQATNYTHAEWQQAERLKDDPEKLKSFFKSCWEQSDSKKSFAAALQEHGYYLAQGDRRGYVAVDYHGEVYSLSRWLKVKTKDLKEKLGKHQDLPSIAHAQKFANYRMTENVREYLQEKRAQTKEQRAPLVQELKELVDHQRQQREKLQVKQRQRWNSEAQTRSKRFRSGPAGIWDIITGKDAAIRKLNKQETEAARQRDHDEMHEMVKTHLVESKELHETIKFYKTQHREEEWRIKKQMAAFVNTATEPIKPKDKKPDIQEKLTELENRIATFSADIASLQGSLDDEMLSDDMKAKIRILIERAKENLLFKKKQEQEVKRTREEKETLLQQIYERMFKTIQTYEQLRQQQQQYQRQLSINTAFYKRVQTMSYSLNGMPMHPIQVYDSPLQVKEFKTKLNAQNSVSLVKDIKTPPPKKQVVNAGGLRQSTLVVSETLKRVKVKTSTPQKAGRHKKLNPSSNSSNFIKDG